MTTITTDDESEAREWLHSAVTYDDFYGVAKDDKHRATILALLDAPRPPRPEDVPDDVLHDMAAASRAETDEGAPPSTVMREAYRALYDHYTAPPPKVEAWAVVWPNGIHTLFHSERAARANAETCPGSHIRKLVEAADE